MDLGFREINCKVRVGKKEIFIGRELMLICLTSGRKKKRDHGGEEIVAESAWRGQRSRKHERG